VVYYDIVEARVKWAAERFYVREVAIDRWNSTATQSRLQAEGITVVPFGQGFASMTAPSKELERLTLEGQLHHGGNPLLRWCVGNVVVEMDPAGNLKPSKNKSTERIDPVVALVMAIGRAMVETQSVYETREMRII
jgi:phage terminase large subunit-like protein